MAGEKSLDTRRRRYERARQFRERGRSDDDQKRNAIAYNRFELVRLIAYPPIVRNRDPIPLADLAKPRLVCRVGRKMVMMALDSEPGSREYLRESFP
jgi:hypothetical protein